MELKIRGVYSPEKERKPGKTCSDCGGRLKELRGITAGGVEYNYFRCGSCKAETADTEQLHRVAHECSAMKTYSAKITRWGQSLGMRIPKELSVKHGLESNMEVVIIPEDTGFRVVPGREKVSG